MKGVRYMTEEKPMPDNEMPEPEYIPVEEYASNEAPEPEYYVGDAGYEENETVIHGDVEAFDMPEVPVEIDTSAITHTDGSEFKNKEHSPYLFVHLADLHLAPRSSSIVKQDPRTGRLIRDLDMTYALHRAVDDVLSRDVLPSACVIAGDIFDTYQASQDAIIDAARELKRLRNAGIEIVSIAGNHDTPTQKKKTPAYVVLRHEFEDIAEDTGVVLAYDEIVHKRVGNVEYVLLPHNAAVAGGFDEADFAPCLGAEKSVLVVHGVAAGDPSLAQQDEMKEIPIAKWIMDMDWDYVAFGHYHKPGWIPGYKGKAAYCGSLENTVISGPDVCHTRGPVYVDMSQEGTDKLEMRPQKIRPIVSLPDIDLLGRDVNAEELDREIAELILAADTDGCIVVHNVKNVPRSVIRTMKRRNFQAVNPEMLYIKTTITALAETPSAMKLNDENVPVGAVETPLAEGEDGDVVEVPAEKNFQPLSQEISSALATLVANGNIRESRAVAVKKILDGVFEKN